MPQCLWCNKEFDKLGKSHIIPTSFFNYDGKTDRQLVSATEHKKRSRTGVYDTNILCSKCEENFSYIDGDAANILLKETEKYKVLFGDDKDKYPVLQLDAHCTKKIKLFLLYTLWKASVSTDRTFNKVNLGPYEDEIKEIIINNTDLNPDDYSFICFKVKEPLGSLCPYRDSKKNWDGLNYYVLDFGIYIFFIKIDKRSSRGVYKTLSDHENTIIIEVNKPPKNRKKIMRQIIEEYKNNLIK